MRFYDLTFFADRSDDEAPRVHFQTDPPIIRINRSDNQFERPCITIHVSGESDLVRFKNNVIWAYEEFLRNKKSIDLVVIDFEEVELRTTALLGGESNDL